MISIIEHFVFCILGGAPAKLAKNINFSVRMFSATKVTLSPLEISQAEFAGCLHLGIQNAIASFNAGIRQCAIGRKICHKVLLLPVEDSPQSELWATVDVTVIQGDGSAIIVVENLSDQLNIEVSAILSNFT